MNHTLRIIGGSGFLFLIILSISILNQVNGLDPQVEKDLKEQETYRMKFCRNQERTIKGLKYQRICHEFNRNYLKFYFSLFLMIAVGAMIRTFLRVFEINIPYTVILIIFGLLIGLGSRSVAICPTWSMYTLIARTPPKIILFIFLPMLIYESAFSMKAHVFYRSAISILVLALPGMIITTFLTAFICQQFFFHYKWSFIVAALFGSIISATDPVAVVAILKEIGTSEMLSIMIEGESLLNDGVAILLYEIFSKIATNPSPSGNQGVEVLTMFCQITIGGPVFGWFMARLSIFFLSRIFNDAAVETSITLVAAYLTYYIGEEFLGVSGVMAVVCLGIVMSAERTCISPEVQGLVHHFWEMLGYLGNTVLFVLVGIVISETAISNVTLEDGYYLIFLYFALNICRFLMIIVLSPLLSHVGYGLSWQNMMVMTWGGLRGAVAICLSLEVFKNRDLCENTSIGPKFLLQAAGIVILTLLVNGTTTKTLLTMLKLTELSVGKIQDMSNAVKQIYSAQQRTLAVLKHDRFLADSSWELVEEFTAIENPYSKHKVRAKKRAAISDSLQSPSLLVDTTDERVALCPNCDGEIETEPSTEEYRDLTEEARLRLLKALKVSCWRQYEQGVLTEEAVQILVDYLENCEDKHLQMFHAKELRKYWEVRGVLAWVRDKLLPYTASRDDDDLPPEPEKKWQLSVYKIITKDWFDGIIHALILLNMIPIIWETVYIVIDHRFSFKEILGFLITNVLFTTIYTIEFILKVSGLGCLEYWSSKWNILDAFVLLISIIELILSFSYFTDSVAATSYTTRSADTDFLKFLRFIRLLRVTRILRLLNPLLPHIMNSLNSKVNVLLFLGYDIGKGLATAIEDVGKFLPQMIENSKVLERFKTSLEAQRLALILEMGLLQKDHPGIAIAVKTRHASRAVLNHMRESLNELKEDGLVDEKEFELLLHKLEQKMKRLWESPSYMPPRRAEMLLANMQWVAGNADLLSYLLKQATLLHFAVGDVIYAAGDLPNGIFIIVSGVVKIFYEPTYDLLQAHDETGEIPNTEIFYDSSFESEMSDYFTSGGILGEMGVVTGSRRAASATCETGVVAFHLSQSSMQKAMEAFDDHYDSLEGRIWRSVGMKLAASVLPTQPNFQSWTMDRVKSHLELSAVPIGSQYLTMSIPDFITDIILIYGQVVNFHNEEETFTAPCLLPHSVTKIRPKDDWVILPRLLIIAKEDFESDQEKGGQGEGEISPSATSLQKCVLARTKRGSIQEEQVDQMHRPSVAISYGVHASRRSSRASRRSMREGSMHSRLSGASHQSSRGSRSRVQHHSHSSDGNV